MECWLLSDDAAIGGEAGWRIIWARSGNDGGFCGIWIVSRDCNNGAGGRGIWSAYGFLRRSRSVGRARGKAGETTWKDSSFVSGSGSTWRSLSS